MSMTKVSDQCVKGSMAASNRTAPYWPLWAACFLGYAAIGMTIQVIPVYAREHMGANAVAAGLAVTIGSLATRVARPIAGRVADQKGARPIVMIGSILGSIGGLAHLIATNIPMLVAARLILGAGEGALFTAAIGWVLADADSTRRGKIAGHFGLSMWTGLAGGPVLGAVFLVIGGYDAVWLAACLLPIMGWLLLLRSPRAAPPLPSGHDSRRALFPRAAWAPGISMAFASIGYPREFWEAVRFGAATDPQAGLAEQSRRNAHIRRLPPLRAVSTIHKAKGLEAPNVVIMPCDGTTFREKDRRLLYVAISRASRNLTLVVSRSNPSPIIEL